MIVIFGKKREIKKQIRRIARKEAERMMAEVQRITTLTPLRGAADRGDWEELKAYRNTDMSPDEILLASERLAAFEEIGMEPSDLMDLVRRDTAKEAVIWGEEKAMYCPACGHFHAVTAEYAQKHQFCEKCGQRVAVPRVSVTKEVL